MKYISKVVWLIIAVVFIASVIIGIGVIFAVKNVNVSLESYTYKGWEEMNSEERVQAESVIEGFKSDVLDKFRGKLMGGVSEEELKKCFEGSDYVLAGFEKDYPCTLNVRLKERRETFAVATSGGFNVYDEYGDFFRVKESIENNVDKAPNILVSCSDETKIKDVAEVSRYFAQNFSALRSMVERIEVSNMVTDNIELFLKCGVGIRIVDYPTQTEAKIKAAYDEFATLSGEEKTHGTIIASMNGSFAAAEYFSS